MILAPPSAGLMLAADGPILATRVGSNRLAFATGDNIGIAIESTPYPCVDIGFSRTEGVVQPVFEDGSVVGVATAGAHHVQVVGPQSVAHITVFAAGSAAATMTRAPVSADTAPGRVGATGKAPGADRNHGAACISERPRGCDDRPPPESGVSSPLISSTTTSIGFRIRGAPQNAASGVRKPNIHLGYRRTGVAVAPGARAAMWLRPRHRRPRRTENPTGQQPGLRWWVPQRSGWRSGAVNCADKRPLQGRAGPSQRAPQRCTWRRSILYAGT
ncbi:hypothetical protein [Roseomonas sp. HF4]|uniref:hypothetical protein n=1 Tax=Roseomonas sp. HF4 TaxID=2562313 RepID=UPI0010BFAD4E|nr:hypothetical protein [Roseomonas sp. HF4]